MRIIYIPIEPFNLRYTKQWYDWFPREFAALGISHVTISGIPLTDGIEHGRFLDVCGTNYYKASQLAIICHGLHNGQFGQPNDIFLFADLWFPGIEMLAYIRDGLGLDFKITGILHAGTYDQFDFLAQVGMYKWGELLENSWFKFVDQIYVATNFHKELILRTRKVRRNKVQVTGLPIKKPPYSHDWKRENQIVFPHRLDPEKNPHEFDKLRKTVGHLLPGWRWVKTMEEYTSKVKYYRTLGSSKIALSFAEQETWGIAMQEALFLGCVPLVPERLSYTEMYDPVFRYRDGQELRDKVLFWAQHYEEDKNQNLLIHNAQVLLNQGNSAIKRMILCMEEELLS